MMSLNIFKREPKPNPFSEEVRKELSSAYLQMTQLPAWKDLEAKMDSMVAASNKDIDNTQIRELTMSEVGRARGIREAISILKHHVDFYVNGG